MLFLDTYLLMHIRWAKMPDVTDLPQVDDTEVINFLLSTEIIPLCLRTMEMGSELSKTVATFIVQKILLDNVSVAPTMSRADDTACVWDQLSYVCGSELRFICAGWSKLHLCHSREILCRECCTQQYGPESFRSTKRKAAQTHHTVLFAPF